jgi:hypothetical protein
LVPSFVHISSFVIIQNFSSATGRFVRASPMTGSFDAARIKQAARRLDLTALAVGYSETGRTD